MKIILSAIALCAMATAANAGGGFGSYKTPVSSKCKGDVIPTECVLGPTGGGSEGGSDSSSDGASQ